MRLIKNTGPNRVMDELRPVLAPDTTLDIATPLFSLFAYAELRAQLSTIANCQLLVPNPESSDLQLLGSTADRPLRNQLLAPWLAKQCAEWLAAKVAVLTAPGPLPQSALVTRHKSEAFDKAITGNCPCSTDGLGLAPGNQ
jgi:hypothetical protein